MSEYEYNPPRGMRDIVSPEAELYEYLFSEFKYTATRHGFKPIITPTIEYFKLFEAKSGEEIKRSMYVFEDKAKRILALRPEVTASVIRTYLRLMRGYPKPIRLYYIAQCFRYEEPQYARYREFWQGGLEIIGDPDVNADLLVALTASDFLERIGLRHVYLVGNVAVYRSFMKKMNLGEEFQDHILHLIDKDQVDRALGELENVIGDEKTELFKELVSISDLDKVREFIDEYKVFLGDLYDKTLSEHERLSSFVNTLREIGYTAVYKPTLVRGLAYYTGLIFEYKVSGAETEPSIGGGGRYDGLTEVYNGPFEYSTGLALGLDRVVLALSRETGLSRGVKTVMILVHGNIPLSTAYSISKKIIENSGDEVEVFVYRARSISRGLEYGNKIGCDLVVLIGEREYTSRRIVVKDMKSGRQELVDIDDLVEYVSRSLR